MTLENKIIATVSFLIGLFVLAVSIYFFCSYAFTNSTHSYVRSLQELIVDFLLSGTAIIGSILLFLKKQRALTFYYSLGTGILLYNVIKFLIGQREVLAYEIIIGKLFVGVFLILYFTSKFGLRNFDEIESKRNLRKGVIIGVLMAILPIIFFHNYLFQEQLDFLKWYRDRYSS